MQAVLVKFYSTENKEPLAKFIPVEWDNFGFWARMIVGEKERGGEESFDIFICTPKWIAEKSEEVKIFSGANHLIVSNYNYAEIYSYLSKLINNMSGNTWDEIGNKICKIAHWEFEDYKK